MKPPVRKVEQIVETLVRCNGISIIMMFRNFRRASQEANRVFKWFESLDNDKKVWIQRASDQWALKLPNKSELIVLPANPNRNYLARAHQIIVDEILLKDEDIVNNIIRPIITVRGDIFQTGVFIYEEIDYQQTNRASTTASLKPESPKESYC